MRQEHYIEANEVSSIVIFVVLDLLFAAASHTHVDLSRIKFFLTAHKRNMAHSLHCAIAQLFFAEYCIKMALLRKK